MTSTLDLNNHWPNQGLNRITFATVTVADYNNEDARNDYIIGCEAGGFGKGSDTKEEIFKQLGKAVAKGEAIPGVFLPYDMTHSGSPCKSNLYISLVELQYFLKNQMMAIQWQ